MLEKLYEILKETPIDKQALINLLPILRELDELDFYHPAHIYGVLDHSIKGAETLDDPFLRLIMIFHDIGKIKTAINVPDYFNQDRTVTKFPFHELESVNIVSDILKNEMDESELSVLLKLIAYHDTPLIINNDDNLMRRLIVEYGVDFVGLLLKVQRADMSTHQKEYYETKIKTKLDSITETYYLKYRRDI